MDYDVYNYMMTGYERKSVSKYDTHKPSELRSVLKQITQLTQTSPVYLVRLSSAKQSYALNLKDGAISLGNTLQMLSEDSVDNVFSRKKAYSNKEEQVSAKIITNHYDMLPDEPEIRVKRLASTQVNTGKEFYKNGKGLSEGTYRFTASVNENVYDFQYNVRKDSGNREVIEGLSNFITKAQIGITAMPVSRTADKIMMRIESELTGAPEGETIFTFKDQNEGSENERGLVSYYAMNQVSSYPKSASLELNGADKTSLSNTLVLGKTLEIAMYSPGDTAARIHYTPDSEQILSGIGKILTSYNKLVDSTLEYSKKSEQPPKLLAELKGVLAPFQAELESCGIGFNEQGHMTMEESLAIQAAEDGNMEETFGKDSGLNRRLADKINQIKINPMDYVEKILVSYPDYGKPPIGFSYITSLYSGMLFNYYC